MMTMLACVHIAGESGGGGGPRTTIKRVPSISRGRAGSSSSSTGTNDLIYSLINVNIIFNYFLKFLLLFIYVFIFIIIFF